MTLVKICGVTRSEDARCAVEAGAEWIGLNFWPKSKRFLADLDAARGIADAARAADDRACVVGVFVDQPRHHIDRICEIVGIDLVQLHGRETPEDCESWSGRAIKAMPIGGRDDVRAAQAFPCDHLLLDAPVRGFGGGGERFDWSLGREVAAFRRVLLAGGLNPDNVAEAIRMVDPFGVDVASGVESSPGVKDPELVCRFVRAAKGDTQ